MWKDIKATLTGKNRKAIPDSCEFNEVVAVDTYEKVLNEDAEELTSEQQSMLRARLSILKVDHDKVKAMRDDLVNS